MTYICDLCKEEKAKSQMRTVGLNGGPCLCKSCHQSVHQMDKYSTLRHCATAIERHELPVRHWIVKSLMHMVEI